MIRETLSCKAVACVYLCVCVCACVHVSSFVGLIPQSCNGMRNIRSILWVRHNHGSINGVLCFNIKAQECLCMRCCFHMVITTAAFNTKAVFIAMMLFLNFCSTIEMCFFVGFIFKNVYLIIIQTRWWGCFRAAKINIWSTVDFFFPQLQRLLFLKSVFLLLRYIN